MSIGVPPCAEQVEKGGDEPEHGEEPVEEIEAAGVEVSAVEPAMHAPRRGARWRG